MTSHRLHAPVVASGPLGLALREAWTALRDRWAERRARSAARQAFNSLDDASLRDLGMARVEFDSYWAETEGWVEPTRIRVTPRPRART